MNILDPAFGLYAMEQEGYLDTRESKLNRVINFLKQSPNPMDPEEQVKAVYAAGMCPKDLSYEERERITREVFYL